MASNSMRLFVGIALAGEAREEVIRVRDSLVANLSRQGVRFVRPDKIHLTLAFLGDVESDQLAGLQEALGELSGLAAPEPRLASLGCFPDMRRPRVVWIGLDDPQDSLQALEANVAKVTAAFASHRDDKPFFPHLTLARVTPGSKVVGRLLRGLSLEVAPATVPVQAITLFHSHPSGDYVELASVGLANPGY